MEQYSETYVITEILKSFSNNGKDARKYLYYYRDNNGKEIDLLIIYDNVVYPIEIKKGASPKIDATKNFDVVKKVWNASWKWWGNMYETRHIPNR